MTLKSKICGVSDLKTLNYLINHNYPPQFIGFIVNYPKSKRHVDKKKLKDLMKIEKKIKERNKNFKIRYNVLLPSKIPYGIGI